MAIKAGTTYIDVVPKVDDKALRKQGQGMGRSIAAGIAAVGIGRLIAGSMEDARESRKIASLTTAALKSTGNAAKVSGQQIAAHAEALAAKTGVDDEAIQSGQNLLLTFTKVRNEVGEGNNVFERATELGLDMSVALGQDAKGAALQLGKALNDPIKGITALSRAGVSFTEQQKDQIKTLVAAGDTLEAQKIILSELEIQFGGAAEAAADPMSKLQVTVGNLKEELGAGLLPVMDGAANALNSMSPEARTAAVRLTLLAGGAGVALVAVGKVADGVSAAKDGIKGASTAVAGMTERFKAARASGESLGSMLKRGLSPGMLAAGAAVGIVALQYQYLQQRKQAVTDATERLIEAQKLENEGHEGAVDSMLADDLARRGLISSAKEMGVSIEDVVAAAKGEADALARVKDGMGAYTDEHRTLGVVTSGVAARTESFSDQIEVLYTAAGNAEQQTGDLATATSELGLEQDTTETKTLSLKEAVDKVANSMDRAEGKAFDLKDATAAYESAVDDARKALKESGGTLDLSTRKGRENHAALRDLARAANDRTEAVYRETGSVERANEVAKTQRQRLREVAERLGVNKDKVDTYTGAIKKIPERVATKVDADISGAEEAIDFLRGRLKDLGQSHTSVNLEAQVGDGLGAVASGSAAEKARRAAVGLPVTMSSGYRPGAVTASGNPSFHADKDNPATDWIGPTWALDEFAARLRKTSHRELLWRVPNHAPGDNPHVHYADTGGVFRGPGYVWMGAGVETFASGLVAEKVAPLPDAAGKQIVNNFHMAEPVSPTHIVAQMSWTLR